MTTGIAMFFIGVLIGVVLMSVMVAGARADRAEADRWRKEIDENRQILEAMVDLKQDLHDERMQLELERMLQGGER